MKHVQPNPVNADPTPAHGETGMPVSDAIARRVSCRAYQPTPVPQAHLMQILEAEGREKQAREDRDNRYHH